MPTGLFEHKYTLGVKYNSDVPNTTSEFHQFVNEFHTLFVMSHDFQQTPNALLTKPGIIPKPLGWEIFNSDKRQILKLLHSAFVVWDRFPQG
jgi:hypothetical protein